ncbi:MAG: CoB--CoM heterodisulfide reductase iron-sulfur subunit B family protein [Campylobacterales bacterium]|nr:CoB--CoM heterodisulfide reductase iron-sulfur subunit B family protein [Campylobacterales bacterium]
MSKIKYAIYTGCTPRESTPELLMSTLAVCKKLDIEVVLLDEATCCGASHLQDFDEFLSLVLNARNICYAERLGLDLITLCNTCQLNTAFTKERLDNDSELKAKVNEKLAEVGLEYKGTSKVKHFVYALKDDVGYDVIKEKVEKPLSQFNVASFYGCHNIRPSKLQNISNKTENPYKPTSLDDLVVALGGKAVEYQRKNSCCGFHVDLQAPETAHKLTGNILLDAIDNNADCVITPCPLCHLNMDVKQSHVSKTMGRDVSIPVLHMQQLLGLALGIDPKELGIDKNVTKVTMV